jgi:NADH-quinone oxidoreductase subunit N
VSLAVLGAIAFDAPHLDYHALAPEIIVTTTAIVVLLVDLFGGRSVRPLLSRLTAIGLLAAVVPLLTLGADGVDRSMFDGGYVVDNFSLVLKAFFLLVAYMTILISVDHLADGDYYEGEYYLLLTTSVLGMLMMASSRDLISIFVALETISIPTYLLAGFKKWDRKSNEAMLKYFLFGVLSSAVMLYGMSLVYGVAGSTLLTDIAVTAADSGDLEQVFTVGVFLTLVGFAFKISAAPFHFWTPDTYEGAPTPVTAFLSVASKAGGFVGIFPLIYIGFYAASDTWQPLLWALAALSMTVGNVVALRQTNVVRMLAYSSIAQAGFMLVPFAVAPDGGARDNAFEATVIYMLVYGAMNMGAFACVIAIARRTKSGEISSFGGLFEYAPALAVCMSLFLFSLAGVPPLAGWFAKFVMFRAVLDANGAAAVTLGIIAAVNSVIAFFYYANIARQMFFNPPAVDDRTPIRIPTALLSSIAMSILLVVGVGIYPQLFARLGELTPFTT